MSCGRCIHGKPSRSRRVGAVHAEQAVRRYPISTCSPEGNITKIIKYSSPDVAPLVRQRRVGVDPPHRYGQRAIDSWQLRSLVEQCAHPARLDGDQHGPRLGHHLRRRRLFQRHTVGVSRLLNTRSAQPSSEV